MDVGLTNKTFLADLGLQRTNQGASNGINWLPSKESPITIHSPIDGLPIANICLANNEHYHSLIKIANKAFIAWRTFPAPQRGEIVRLIGEELRKNKENLGRMVSLEMGKIYQEGLGEVQEMIDICDFAVGLSRQLHGSTMHSERFEHRMYDQYHPLGTVGVITAFNFPVAVWAWNAMIGMVCGNVILWKPSLKTPLCAIAVQNIVGKVMRSNKVPEGVLNLIISESVIENDLFLSDQNMPLISATGSTVMGKHVARIVAQRLGKTILELGGNNALIVCPSADVKMALHATLFGAVGTAGQRCTTTRRLIIHESLYEEFVENLIQAYQQISERIGNPLDPNTLVGPLIDRRAVKSFRQSIERVKKEGGKVLFGGEICSGIPYESGCYVVPAIAVVANNLPVVRTETFGPLLYVMKYSEINEAIELQNNVPQGLSSAIFTLNMREAELFLSAKGSDCGIANVNIGTSGAEVGGAFGGEKETGGGRESGSDAWKSYMRRQTNTINYGSDLPLAQGVSFDI